MENMPHALYGNARTNGHRRSCSNRKFEGGIRAKIEYKYIAINVLKKSSAVYKKVHVIAWRDGEREGFHVTEPP
jgi:hypothetical protein